MKKFIRNLIIGGLLALPFVGCYYRSFVSGRVETTTEVPRSFYVAGEVVKDFAEFNEDDSYAAFEPGLGQTSGDYHYSYKFTVEDENGELHYYRFRSPTYGWGRNVRGNLRAPFFGYSEYTSME